MNNGHTLEISKKHAALEWAAARQAPLSVSLLPEGQIQGLRSQMIRYDAQQDALQILYPISPDRPAPPEISAGQQLGVSFRRGHKKCIFVATVVMRRQDASPEGTAMDTLVLRAPAVVREMQRRLYQRVIVPPDRLVAARLWQGGPPKPDRPTWPICAGRVGNLSVGGVLIELRADQNPRLSVGECVGVEITTRIHETPLVVEAQYRHCVLLSPERLGLGLQFIGLEQDSPGRATLTQIAEFVKELRRSNTSVQPPESQV